MRLGRPQEHTEFSMILHTHAVFHQGSPCKAVDVTSPLPPVEVFQKAARQLSEQSANLAVLFSCVPPLPSSMECTAYACDVERAAASLAASYNHIPPIYGVCVSVCTPYTLLPSFFVTSTHYLVN